MGLRKNTKRATVRVVTGTEPIDTRLAFLKLKHHYRILLKPDHSLVKTIFNKIGEQKARPGFSSECRDLCENFGIPYSRVVPELVGGQQQPLADFGDELKEELYYISFQRDLQKVKNSGQASTLASLFPPDTSYFSYRPLDLITRVLVGQNRTVRTLFLQNLCGTSFLANRYRNSCHFCGQNESTIDHYIFDCPNIAEKRASFLLKVENHVSKTDPLLKKIWDESIENENRRNLCAILFGGNFAVQGNGETLLFRKSRYTIKSHHSDKTVLLTAAFMEELQQTLESAGAEPRSGTSERGAGADARRTSERGAGAEILAATPHRNTHPRRTANPPGAPACPGPRALPGPPARPGTSRR